MTTNNHPAHGPVSLDRLHQIREVLSKAAAQSDGGNLGYAMADAVKVIDKAIAAFNAELYVPTVQCWSCREVIEVSAVGDCDGYCPKCDSPIDLDEEPYDAAILQAGNSPVIPDGWISCSEQMPEETGDIIVVSDGIVMSGISYSRRDGFYIAALEYDDDEPIGGVTHWMPLPEPPQEVNRG
nr:MULTISPECIES: DUF551 domain-containing protein [Enterobacteriaceae]